jgi:LPS export ABC transporter protein LptC
MKKSQLILFALLGLVISLAVGMYVFRTVEDSRARTRAESNEPDPAFPRIVGSADQILLKGVNYTHVKDGRPQWTLKADDGVYIRAKNRLKLGKLRITFFPSQGGKVLLTADHGVFNRKTNVMVVTGNVHSVDQTGQHLYTQSLTYRTIGRGQRVISTRLPVRFVGPRMNVKGKYGMICQVDMQKVTLYKSVRSRFTSPPRKAGPAHKGGPR